MTSVVQTASQALAAELKGLLGVAELVLECKAVENSMYDGHQVAVASLWNGKPSYPRVFVAQLVGRYTCLLDPEHLQNSDLDDLNAAVEQPRSLDEVARYLVAIFR